MPVFDGFGVNYKAKQSNWAADIAYFKSIGLKSIRPHMALIPMPWLAGTPQSSGSVADINAYWRLCAQTFANAGFWVTWGVCSGGLTITDSNWPAYHDAVVAEAAYLQSQGIALGDFEIANESEQHVDNVTMTITQLNANLRQLARDVKAAYNLSPISKGCAVNGANLSDWMANGLGSLDTISLHTYGSVRTASQQVDSTAFKLIANVLNSLGAGCYISEFNVASTVKDILGLGGNSSKTAMRGILDSYIIGRVERALVYSWVGYLNGDNQFAQLYKNGAMNPMWFEFFTANPQFYGMRASTVARSASVTRATPSDRTASLARYLSQ